MRRASSSASATVGHRAAHHVDVCGRQRDVGATPHRDTDVGRGQRGGVVQAVADEDHAVAGFLKPGDAVDLAVGEHLGQHMADAGLGGDRLGRHEVVARHHLHLEPQPPQALHRLCRLGLNPTGNGHDPDRDPSPPHREWRAPGCGEAKRGVAEIGWKVTRTSDPNLVPPDGRDRRRSWLDPVPGRGRREVTNTMSRPLPLMVAPTTSSPGPTSTGTDSPREQRPVDP